MSITPKVVLAFSGGLDTTFCAIWLREQGYEVHALTVQTGGFTSDELHQIEVRAQQLGVASFEVADLTHAYYEQCIRYLIYGNVLKNGTYPLSVSAERITQAIAVANHVQYLDAQSVAHGSTGAGNDQVRFDMVFQSLVPNATIITPIRDLKLSRQAEIDYLRERGFDFDFSKAAYSINKGPRTTAGIGLANTCYCHRTATDQFAF
jgi:argininosuccinate synthase